jgi:hypothetical protein
MLAWVPTVAGMTVVGGRALRTNSATLENRRIRSPPHHGIAAQAATHANRRCRNCKGLHRGRSDPSRHLAPV